MRRKLSLLLSSFLALSAATPMVFADLKGSLQGTAQIVLKSQNEYSPFLNMEESIPPPETIAEPRKPHFRFDARENSVGVVFTTEDEEVMHLWIPLGRKLYTRDSPMLPLHPYTARVTTMIHTSAYLAAPEQLNRIQCDLWTYSNRTQGRGKGRPEKWKVSFSKEDELVRFADRSGSGRFWLGGKEVESYECS